MNAGAPHYVIIGNGMAGNQAAMVLRELDPECRITIISAGALLFINRYDLPNMFRGSGKWVDLLVHPPEYYEENRITVRRRSVVNEVHTRRHLIRLAHREAVGYDRLVVATGGRSFIPEIIKDSRHLMHLFNSVFAAVQVRGALPDRGKVIMLGGDMIGLDLARALVELHYQVTLIPDERTFWPHVVPNAERPKFYAALEKMGIEIAPATEIEKIAEGAPGMPARRVVCADGSDLHGDVVMPFYGLVPNIDFMGTSGIDMERGILVDAQLKSSVDDVWAAGDVCQIWSPERNEYRFYYGYRNVRGMGETAARNVVGGTVEFLTDQDEELQIDDEGHMYSPFWEHE